MKIKRISENKYTVYDDEGRRIGKCSVTRREFSRIFTDAPVQFEISVSCTGECRDLLYGAAVTRARVLAAAENAPCRVYADISPTDKDALAVLTALGFINRDGIMRMYRPVTDERITQSVPRSCTIVRDFLDNEDELRRSLVRYNECFDAHNDVSWLREIASQENFARILMVSPTELCGELMVWTEGDTGVIGILQVARAWRRQGVASYLVEDARKYFSTLGMRRMSFDVWLSAPGNLPLARKSGYKKGEMLALYPELP